MSTEIYDWTNFSVSYYYPAKINEIFDFWSTGSGLKKFFIENISLKSNGQDKYHDKLIESNDLFSWTWRHGHSISGIFTEVVPNNRVSFTFGDMLVSVKFTEVGNKTLVKLNQSKISLDEPGMVMGHLNCRSCWVFFMANLKSIILNGTDLRDEDPEITSSYEVGFEQNRAD